MKVPIGERIIVENLKKEYKGNIIIPDTIKERFLKAKVLKTGLLKTGELSELQEGDIIMYPKGMGIEVEGEIFVEQKDVFLKFN